MTIEEVEDWENFPFVFITPDGDGWDPYTSHFAENEAAMIDVNGLIVEHDTRLPRVLFTEADLCKRGTSSTMPLIQLLHPKIMILDVP